MGRPLICTAGGAWEGGLSSWSNGELTSVLLGLVDLVACFCLCLTSSRSDHVDLGHLFAGLQSESLEPRQFEGALVEVVQLVGSLAKLQRATMAGYFGDEQFLGVF